jgi:hypothetical protein
MLHAGKNRALLPLCTNVQQITHMITNSVDFCLQANYTDQVAATYQRG